MSSIPEARMKSIRPYKTSEQYLYAMKEDLVEWLKDLYDVDITTGSFLQVLETGVWLCHHANCISQVARDFGREYPKLSARIRLPSCGVTCNSSAQPGTFQARDNVSNFIQWCRKEMDIQEVLMFETEDLVLRKNEKSFVLCLLEVARRASRFGLRAPTLVRMEEEIEDEIRQDLNLPPEETPLPKPQREPTHFRNLDQMVQHLVSRCTCPVQFSMIKVSEGKYRVGESSTLIFVRILRKHVMVRVGGGWDTLEHYLDKHDPCRCTSLSHKQAVRTASPPRTPARQVQHEITAHLTPRTDDPRKPQPALIVRRSQSPPAPVEWRTYAPQGRGAGRRASSVAPAERISAPRGSGQAAGVPVSRDHAEAGRPPPSCRLRGRSATPPGSRTAAEEGRAAPTPGRSELSQGSVSLQPKGNVGKDASGSKRLPCPRPESSPQEAAAAQREKGTRPAPAGAAWRRAGTPQPPGGSQQEGTGCPPARPSSPAKPLRACHTQASLARTADSASGQEIVRTSVGWRKDATARRSPSPAKNTCRVHRMDAPASGHVGWTSRRSPTPSKSYQGGLCVRNGGDAVGRGQRPRSEVASQEEQGEIGPVEAFRWTFAGCSRAGIHHVDSEGRGKGRRPCWGRGEAPDRPGKDSRGDTKQHAGGEERVYTPLPLNLAEERALYQSLEEEITANVKELEAASDDGDLAGEIWSGGYRRGGSPGPASGLHGPRLTTLGMALPQGHRRGPGGGEGVPRSGVYVPERDTRWHPVGERYEDVIQELCTALRRDHVEAVSCLSPSSASLVSGTQVALKVPERKSPCEEKGVIPEAEPPTATDNVHQGAGVDGATSEVAESLAFPEEAALPPNKPKRSLKKPERVPSIYKLKLRPKIRPRRDNRPEKRPSRIPRPVAYRCAQRPASVKGQGKTRSPRNQGRAGWAKAEQDSSGNVRAGGEAGWLSEQGEARVAAQGETGVPRDRETWV